MIAVALLLFLAAYLVLHIAAYQRRKSRLIRQKICDSLSATEREQVRIAQELHDDIGNALTAIRLKVELGEVTHIANDLGEVIDRLRAVSFNMSGVLPGDGDLCNAIKKLVVRSHIPASVDCRVPALNSNTSLQVYRIIQELLTNTIRHAGATRITLTVSYAKDTLRVRFSDNGKGFDRDKISFTGSAGIRNIQARTMLLNGTAYLFAGPGEGVSWEFEFPLPPQREG